MINNTNVNNVNNVNAAAVEAATPITMPTRMNFRNDTQWYDIEVDPLAVEEILEDIAACIRDGSPYQVTKPNGMPSLIGPQWLANCVVDVYVPQPQVTIVPMGGTPAPDTAPVSVV